MFNKVNQAVRHAGVGLATLGASLALFGSAIAQDSAADGSDTEGPCEFYFYPEQPGTEIRAGAPLAGRIEVSPGCQFFQFPNKSEAELVTDPALTELTGAPSHFRITPNGELLFIIEPPAQARRPLVSSVGDDACAQPPVKPDPEIEQRLAELSQAREDKMALEARLAETRNALQQAQADHTAARDQIGQLEQSKAEAFQQTEQLRMALSESRKDVTRLQADLNQAAAQSAAAEERQKRLWSESEAEAARVGLALAEARAAAEQAGERITALEAELSGLREQAVAEVERNARALLEAQGDNEARGAELAQSRTAAEQERERIAALETELNQLKEQAAADSDRLGQTLEQAKQEKAEIGAALSQVQTAEQQAREQIGALEAELAQSRAAAAEVKQSLADAKAAIAALTARAADKARAAKERLEQAAERVARLDETLEKARTDAAKREAELEAEIAGLKQANAAMAPWEGRYQECAVASERCSTELAAKDQQIDRMTADMEAMKRKLEGLAGDADGDGVADVRDQCPNTPSTLATDASGCVSIELLGVEFETGSYRLRPTSKEILDNMARLLKEASLPVEIQGHTDNSGTPEGNQQLSEVRARAVVDYLVGRGVAAESLSSKGYGDTRPIADNETPEGRRRNRRVELTTPRR